MVLPFPLVVYGSLLPLPHSQLPSGLHGGAARVQGQISRRSLLNLAVTPLLVGTTMSKTARGLSLDYTTVESGITWADLKLGEGAPAVAGQRVTIDYSLTRRGGSKIHSTREAGEPFSWTLGNGSVIEGLEQAVIGGGGVPPMLLGGARRVIVPQTRGYGVKEASWQTLVRELEPIPPEFIWTDVNGENVNSYLRFKNLYLNPNRIDQPDAVFDIKLRSVSTNKPVVEVVPLVEAVEAQPSPPEEPEESA